MTKAAIFTSASVLHPMQVICCGNTGQDGSFQWRYWRW